VERLLSVAIFTSFPISLYGIIQRFGLDPIPWAGNVTERVTGNMGNSIFIAAFLIMIFPLTIARVIRIMNRILYEKQRSFFVYLNMVVYVVMIVGQLAAIYFSGSRGPWLGLGLGVMVFWFGLSVIWGKPWIAKVGIGVAIVSALFLVSLNIPGGPLSGIRSLPGIGRLGQILDSESRTGKVRTLIWQGVAKLVAPHEPLEFPDGTQDRVNILRPLIGYGPESLFVSFNRFYQPRLAEVEKRNASPDRSHNEIWDSMAFTGLLGLASFFFLFGSILFYSSKWLGFVENPRQMSLFLASVIGGAILTATFFSFWKGFHFAGVGLPFGLILGGFIFLALKAAFFSPKNTPVLEEINRKLLMLAIFSAIMAHFMELIFGFGIASTRTYFWILSAVLVVIGVNSAYKDVGVGMDLFTIEEKFDAIGEKGQPSLRNTYKEGNQTKRMKRKQGTLVPRSSTINRVINFPEWLQSSVLGALMISVALITLGFAFISIQGDHSSINSMIWPLLAYDAAGGIQSFPGFPLILLGSWLVFGFVLTGDFQLSRGNTYLFRFLGLMIVLSGLIFFLYILVHAGNLAEISRHSPVDVNGILQQIRKYEAIYLMYVFSLIILMGITGVALIEKWPAKFSSRAGVSIGILLFVIAFSLGFTTNQRNIRADIAFKAADSFTQPEYWPIAIKIYHRALELAPNEDYYYLFLARAYLEHARSLEDNAQRIQLIEQAEKDMLIAQLLNPLNTDHTANLARINSTWADYTEDYTEKAKHAVISSDYYESALKLSPYNARLWGEWALLLFSQLSDFQSAQDKLNTALEIDPSYEWLHSLQGELYFKNAETLAQENPEKVELYRKALSAYQQGLDLTAESDTTSQYRNLLSIARTYSRLELYQESIRTYQEVLNKFPNASDVWRIQEVIARLLIEMGDRENAMFYAQQSKTNAPADQQSRIDELIRTIETLP
jgi:tetratricopeptide (TPR) repeat protein